MPAPIIRQVLVLILLAAVSEAQESRKKLFPVDEIPKCPEAATFRRELRDALQRRDKKYIYSILSPNIKLSFGGDDGQDAFDDFWRINDPASKFWDTMASLLVLGGSVNAACSGFTAPYVFTAWPEEYDAFDNVAVVGEHVRLRAGPGLSAPIVKLLSYDIVELHPSSEDTADWVRVRVLVKDQDGASGFVSRRYVRSPVDYRAFFARENGRWKMTTLVAGD